MSETVIRSRIDSNLKLEAQALLGRFGLTMSDAIRLFLNQVVLEKGIPFQVKLSEEQGLEHDRWFHSQVKEALVEADKPGTKLVPHSTVSTQWAAKRQSLMKQSGKKSVA